MGVSFKVAKAGKRYRPKPLQIEEKDSENGGPNEYQQRETEGDLAEVGDRVANLSSTLVTSELQLVSEDQEVSFSLNLFSKGFSVGKANELLDDVPKQLHPYDRASESLFCAIEYGYLPGDIFDDIPCKYIDGALLCEIRDYRNSLSREGDSSSVDKSATTYKVVLKMCTENVVKDISGISDDSWTYSDLLEVESRILKALRPVLHLNPKPVLDRIYEKSSTKKLNLGISWSWKKRKLGDASATDVAFGSAVTGTNLSEVCFTHNSESQSDLAFQNREVPFSQQLIPSSIHTSLENNILQVTAPQSSPVLPQSNYPLAGNSKQFVSKGRTLSNCVSAPNQYHSNSHSDTRKLSTLALNERESCGTLVKRGLTFKKPKQEPLDFSQQQLPGSQAQMSLASELLWKKKLLNQRMEAEKILHERTDGKKHPSSSLKSGQQATLEGIPKLQARTATCRVKEEPMEFNEFPCLGARKNTNNCKIMDMGNQSDLQQPLRSAQLVRANAPPTTVQLNHTGQSFGKKIENELVSQKRKPLQIAQVSTGVRNASANFPLGDSLTREACVPTKRESNSRLKGSTVNRVESHASTNHMNAFNATCHAVGVNRVESLASTGHTSVVNTSFHPVGTPASWSSAVCDPVIDRFAKIKKVTQRYGLGNRKRKFSQIFERRPFFCPTPLVAFHLCNSANRNLKDGSTDGSHVDSLEGKLNVCKTRTLTFVRSSCISQRNEIYSSEAQNKLIITEKLDEGVLEGSVVYGHETPDPIELPLLQTFPNSHHAVLFAVQFNRLMSHEGFRLVGDQIEHVPPSSTVIQQPTVTSSAIPAAETFELPRPTLVTEQSPYMLGPTSSTMSAVNPSQLQLQNNIFGGQFLPHRNIHSALQLQASYFPQTHLDIAARLSPMHQQWQQIINKRAFLQFQMMQREMQQQQLLQSKMMVGGSGVATGLLGTVQLRCGTQGPGNVAQALGSFTNTVGMGGSSSISMGGNIPGIGNMGEVNTPAADLARMRIAETKGRALMSGLQIQRHAGLAPTYPVDMANNVMNQQPTQLQTQQQLCMAPQQQQETRPPFQRLEATSLAEHVGSPRSLVGHNYPDQCLQMSPQLSCASGPQQMVAGTVGVGHESPDLSSKTPGSVGSCNILELHGVIKGGSAIQPDGVK